MPLSSRRAAGGRPLKQQGLFVSVSVADGQEDDTWMVVLTKLHVPHGLPIAPILEDHHVGTVHAAGGVRAARM